jgi:hypothetical protein
MGFEEVDWNELASDGVHSTTHMRKTMSLQVA